MSFCVCLHGTRDSLPVDAHPPALSRESGVQNRSAVSNRLAFILKQRCVHPQQSTLI